MSILGEAVVLLVEAADLVVDHQSLAVVRILGSLVVDYSLLVDALEKHGQPQVLILPDCLLRRNPAPQNSMSSAKIGPCLR